MDPTLEVPEGYARDARGRLVPESLIKPIDRLRDDLVNGIIDRSRGMARAIGEFKADIDDEICSFLALSVAEYGVHYGGQRGNLQLLSFDGLRKVTKQIQDRLVFDERMMAAKDLIDECLTEWGQGSDPRITMIVQNAFQVDKRGRISTERVLGLRRLNIHDPKWKEAMQAITDSIQVESSKAYFRFYERDTVEDEWRTISVDIASVEQS